MAEHSRTHRWLAAAAATLGALALVTGEPYPAGRESDSGESGQVTPIELARWIRDGESGLRVVDVRSSSDFAKYHVPGAEHASLEAIAHRDWRRDGRVVFYGARDAESAAAARLLRRRGAARVYELRGGLQAWVDQLIEPQLPMLSASATAEERTARRQHLELSRYFGGTPLVGPVPSSSTTPGAVPVPSRQREAAALARTLRRGC